MRTIGLQLAYSHPLPGFARIDNIISALLSINTALVESNCRLSHLSVGLCQSIRKVYCGKTADWIRLPFGLMSGVGREMGVLDGGGDR